METSNGLAAQNGHSIWEDLAAAALTTGVSLRMPNAVRNGVVLYGQMPSLNGSGRVYWVKKRRLGVGRFRYACTCEGNFLGNHLCRHIAAFRLAELEQ